MYYILYGNDKETLRRELSPKRQEYAKTEVESLKNFAMDIFSEDLINGTDIITFVKVMKKIPDEVVFSISGDHLNSEIFENKKYFKNV